jgi:rubrerythrin
MNEIVSWRCTQCGARIAMEYRPRLCIECGAPEEAFVKPG